MKAMELQLRRVFATLFGQAHTGSIYERVFYLESNGRWYPHKDLRNRSLVDAERGLIKDLWDRVAVELGTALFK